MPRSPLRPAAGYYTASGFAELPAPFQLDSLSLDHASNPAKVWSFADLEDTTAACVLLLTLGELLVCRPV